MQKYFYCMAIYEVLVQGGAAGAMQSLTYRIMKKHGRPWNSWANLQKEKNPERKRDGFHPRM